MLEEALAVAVDKPKKDSMKDISAIVATEQRTYSYSLRSIGVKTFMPLT